jgi:hypothetical protein
VKVFVRAALLPFATLLAYFIGPTPLALASVGTVAIIPPSTASLCGGALAESLAELRAARFVAQVVPANEESATAAFDAAIRFAPNADAVVVVDLRVPGAPVELATLRLNCKERLARRRVWTIVVEMLWSLPPVTDPDASVGAQNLTIEPASPHSPSDRTLSAKQPFFPPKPIDLSKPSTYFGAGPALGINSFELGPTWDVAMMGGVRMEGGWRLGGRLRWPVSVSEHKREQTIMRLWTFTADLETAHLFARPSSAVSPYVGVSTGLNFTLVDAGGSDTSQDRRWDAFLARALFHAGLQFATGSYSPFCQLEAGIAHRLFTNENARSVQSDSNSFVTAASIGILFDY